MHRVSANRSLDAIILEGILIICGLVGDRRQLEARRLIECPVYFLDSNRVARWREVLCPALNVFLDSLELLNSEHATLDLLFLLWFLDGSGRLRHSLNLQLGRLIVVVCLAYVVLRVMRGGVHRVYVGRDLARH